MVCSLLDSHFWIAVKISELHPLRILYSITEYIYLHVIITKRLLRTVDVSNNLGDETFVTRIRRCFLSQGSSSRLSRSRKIS